MSRSYYKDLYVLKHIFKEDKIIDEKETIKLNMILDKYPTKDFYLIIRKQTPSMVLFHIYDDKEIGQIIPPKINAKDISYRFNKFGESKSPNTSYELGNKGKILSFPFFGIGTIANTLFKTLIIDRKINIINIKELFKCRETYIFYKRIMFIEVQFPIYYPNYIALF